MSPLKHYFFLRQVLRYSPLEAAVAVMAHHDPNRITRIYATMRRIRKENG